MEYLEYWWVHLLLLFVYQTLGTIRHELSHALAAKYYGADILEFKVWPTYEPDRGLYFGYVKYSLLNQTIEQRKTVLKMPYIVAVISALIGLLVHFFSELTGFWAVFAIINLIVSPVVDLCFNLYKGLVHGKGDIGKLREL